MTSMIKKILSSISKKKEIEFIKSPNYSGRPTGDVSLIVIHWTGGSFKSCVNWFKNKKSRCSAHYVISKEGKIVQMVKEEFKAWHAGRSYLEGYGKNVNNFSIGIELEGPPSTLDLEKWPVDQLLALVKLCVQIQGRFPDIKLTDHSTIAPDRKVDVLAGTGPNKFPWQAILRNTGIPDAVEKS